MSSQRMGIRVTVISYPNNMILMMPILPILILRKLRLRVKWLAVVV